VVICDVDITTSPRPLRRATTSLAMKRSVAEYLEPRSRPDLYDYVRRGDLAGCPRLLDAAVARGIALETHRGGDRPTIRLPVARPRRAPARASARDPHRYSGSRVQMIETSDHSIDRMIAPAGWPARKP
jgi:hypothetical protein